MPIDFHQHIMVPTEYDAGNARVGEHVVAHIDAHGGGKAVVLPLAKGNSTAMAKEKWGKDQTAMRTDYALQAYDRFPDTIIPFCHVDPLHPDALDEIHRYHEAGCMGFGEHKVRLPVDHPDSMDIYELCGKLGWVVPPSLRVPQLQLQLRAVRPGARGLSGHYLRCACAGVVGECERRGAP